MLKPFFKSPGGTVVDADGIYQALKKYKEDFKVPMFAYIDGVCASEGYYIAMAADKIYASGVSHIGSIGVIAPAIFNYSKLLDKVGIEAKTLYAGIDKDVFDPYRPWSPTRAK